MERDEEHFDLDQEFTASADDVDYDRFIERVDRRHARQDHSLGIGERGGEPRVGRSLGFGGGPVGQPAVAQRLDLHRGEIDIVGPQISQRDPAVLLKVLEQACQLGGKLARRRRRGHQRADDQEAKNPRGHRLHPGSLVRRRPVQYTLSI